jgi:anti-anti-sigma factor
MTADPSAEVEAWFSLALVPARGEGWLAAIGELDLAAAPTLHDRVGELLAAGCDRLVIDLREVTFIDLTGVRLLLALARDADDGGWRLSLIQNDGQVRQMLTLTGALDQLPLRSSLGRQ